MRVVILDDEKKVLDLICALIDWGTLDLHLCGTAGDGESALKVIEKERPDLLITDIKMPGMSGIEIIEKAKAFLPALRAIVISGYSRFDYAQSAIRQGVINYLLKPINKEELNDTLKKIIDDAKEEALASSRTMQAEAMAKSLALERNKAALLEMISGQADEGADALLSKAAGGMGMLSLKHPVLFIAVKIDSALFPCDIKTEKAIEEQIAKGIEEVCCAANLNQSNRSALSAGGGELSSCAESCVTVSFRSCIVGEFCLMEHKLGRQNIEGEFCLMEHKLGRQNIVASIGGTVGEPSISSEGIGRIIAERVFEMVKKQQELFHDYTFTVSYSMSAKAAVMAMDARLTQGVNRIYDGDAVWQADVLSDELSFDKASHDVLRGGSETADALPISERLRPMFAAMVSGNKAEYIKRRDDIFQSFQVNARAANLLGKASPSGHNPTERGRPLGALSMEQITEMADVIMEEVHVRLGGDARTLDALDDMAFTLNMPRTAPEAIERMTSFCDAVYDALERDSEEKCARPVRDAQRYIAEHYNDNMLCLDSVAEQVELSPNYLSALFKKNCSIGMAEYIQNLRMEKAKELLTRTSVPVKQIAYNVGYNDPKHFSKTFKQAVGMKPNEYRKLYE